MGKPKTPNPSAGKKKRFFKVPADKIGTYRPTPISDARMTSKRAEERARQQLEAAKWRRGKD